MKKLPSLLLVAAWVTVVGYLSAPFAVAASHEQPPMPIKQFQPIFPFELYKQGVSGSAKVEFTVDTEGNVTKPRVIEATHEDFGRMAIACISKWKFKPGIKDGQPADVVMQMSFFFENPQKKRANQPPQSMPTVVTPPAG